ncbi:MAG: YihY/virulence factor BrkB family protein [Actinomycetia bacterium]|nr:YihY/virulence factor BrkB family protein [Actinomycetes bacterium]
MNPERILRRVDAFQQRNRPVGFVFAVVKKFGDDRAGMLAALMSYYGFLALFPLLLLLVTILGFALRGNPSLQDRVLRSTLSDLPIIGDQLRTNIHSLRASPVATVVGVVGLLWGSLGVTQAAQFAMAQVWNVQGKDRPGFVTRLVRGLLFIGTLGLGIALTTLLAQVGAFSAGQAMWLRVVSIAGGVALNIGLYVVAFRVLTPKQIELRALVPGAVLGGIGWTLLQFLGTYLVDHQLKHTSQVYGVFAVVLGLVAWLYLNAQLTMYAAEFNVVRARHLWPRTLLQPPLSAADRVVLRDIAKQEARRPEQTVMVGFDDPAAVPPER